LEGIKSTLLTGKTACYRQDGKKKKRLLTQAVQESLGHM
jgi:hypothetical protein